jgi:hypothetical protein
MVGTIYFLKHSIVLEEVIEISLLVSEAICRVAERRVYVWVIFLISCFQQGYRILPVLRKCMNILIELTGETLNIYLLFKAVARQ